MTYSPPWSGSRGPMGTTGKRYTQAEMVAILREAAGGDVKVAEVLRRHGVAPKTYYRWKSRLGFTVNGVGRARNLEAENLRLKRIVADQSLNIQVLQDLLAGVPSRKCC